jgi:hypothetical protein
MDGDTVNNREVNLLHDEAKVEGCRGKVMLWVGDGEDEDEES